MKNPIKRLFIFLIETYQLTLSPRFSHGSCRFTPTCSQYAIEAIETHGIFKGSALAIWRIMRCNPFNKGGYDPVPPKKS
jgi:putative membrane protein insertion efficiency factor